MSRLSAELDRIDNLSLGEGMSKGMQATIVAAGVMGGLMLLSYLKFQPENESGPKQLNGLLSPYVVSITPEDQVACRATACTFVVAAVTAAPIGVQRMAFSVPASAVVRNNSDRTIWLVIDESAVPVSVQELERGADTSVVTEKPGVRELPMRAVDWRALSAYGRRRVFLAAKNFSDVNLNKLLLPDARVIEWPNGSLKPGSKVRSRNAGS